MGASGLQDRGLESLPSLVRDLLAAGRAHDLQDLHQERVVEALRLGEIVHVLDVQEEFPPLLVLVRLILWRCQKRRRSWNRRKLVKVARQDLARHAAPRLARLRVLGRVQIVAQTSTVRLPQSVCVQEICRNASQLVDDFDAQVSGEAVHLLLGLWVESQPGRLQGVGHEKAVGRVQRPAV